MTRIAATVLTGSLGAGKSTFMNGLISVPRFPRTAVIVNQFGDDSVDGGLSARADERALATSAGCLVCWSATDGRRSLLHFLTQVDLGHGLPDERIVVETPGLVDPAMVLQCFMSNDDAQDRFVLIGGVILVDAVNGTDPLARVERRHPPIRRCQKHSRVASAFCFRAAAPIEAKARQAGVAGLQDLFGRDLLQIKGLVEVVGVPGCPPVLHAVGHVSSPPRFLDAWLDGIATARIVVVASGRARRAAPDLLVELLPELRTLRTTKPAHEFEIQ
ncbi:MAG: hypothetical protein NXH97_09060 [Rhodobacteraceae bacterium]|nr:hypothetical protein [Paracoccaceae bacterium]